MDEFGMNNAAFDSGVQDTPPRVTHAPEHEAERGNNLNARRQTAAKGQRTADARNTTRRIGAARTPELKPKYTLVDFIFDRRTHMGLGIFLIIVALAMAVMTISHLAHGGADQSLATGRTLSQMAVQPDQVENIGGAFGAKLSHWLMSDGLGVGAFVLVLWLGMLGLALVGTVKCNFWAVTFRCLFTAVALSVIVGLITYSIPTYTHWGGSHGHYINSVLIKYSSWLGAIAVSLILAGLLVSVYLNPLLRARRLMRDKMEAARVLRRERNERQRRQGLQPVDMQETSSADGVPQPDSIAFETADKTETVTAETAAVLLPEIDEDKAHIATGSTDERSIAELHDPAASDLTMTDERDFSPVQSEYAFPSDVHADNQGFDIDYLEHGDDIQTGTMSPADEVNPEPGDNQIVAHTPSPAQETVNTAEDAFAEVPGTVNSDIELDDSPSEPAFDITVAATVEQRSAYDPVPGHHSGLDLPYDPRADLSRFRMPGIDLLSVRDSGPVIDEAEQAENKDMIVQTLRSYKIGIDRIEATVGPTVTLYEIVPAEGVRISQIKNLEDDIALSLAALGIRIIAPIPGKGTIGIEVPNRDPRTVSIRSVLGSRKFAECTMKLPMAMGTTISDDVFIRDLADMPHLLVAGGSGQGKSVGLNCIIASLLYFKHPAELKLVLIDPKMVEFSRYTKLQNHYLARIPGADEPIVTDPNEALATLNSLCVEMDNRYRLLRDAGAVKVEEYNKKFNNRELNPENGHRYLPYIVIIVDEFADLIMTAGKEVSNHIARIAQKARAVGMHMIIATQRPSTDVITGMIKANFLGRIAFRVQQRVDSMTILDRPGANQLIGRGDMLFSHNGKMERVQCAFIDSDEIDRITRFIDDQMGYSEPYLLPEPHVEGAAADAMVFDPNHRDALFDDCARFIVSQSTASTSSLQRRFGIGYNKAGKIMDQMEAAGIVGGAQGSKPRAVLVDSITLETILSQ